MTAQRKQALDRIHGVSCEWVEMMSYGYDSAFPGNVDTADMMVRGTAQPDSFDDTKSSPDTWSR